MGDGKEWRNEDTEIIEALEVRMEKRGQIKGPSRT